MGSEPPTEQIPSRFNILESIGTGGFGEVWHARDEQTNRSVALKLPVQDDGGALDDIVVSKFEQERTIFSQLQKAVTPASVVRCLEIDPGDHLSIALEYIDGTELDEFLKETDTEPGINTVRQFGLPLLKSIEFLHHNDIVYLDFKPENVLVRVTPEKPVLIDFNTAITTDKEPPLFAEGDFKAPEQIKNSSNNHYSGKEADVYAAGKLVYYLLTGNSTIDTQRSSGSIQPDIPSTKLPDGASEVLMKALEPDPKTRLSTVTPLINEIRGIATSVQSINRKATIVAKNTEIECPVRPGDMAGQISEGDYVPDISINDPGNYISPLHFEVAHDGESWIIRDHSLNGTYVRDGTDWYWLLSQNGYKRLSNKAPDRVPDNKPPGEMRVRSQADISPVNEDYAVTMVFNP